MQYGSATEGGEMWKYTVIDFCGIIT